MGSDIINIVFKLIITVIFIVITECLIPYVEARIGTEKWNQITDFAEKCVLSAEKLYTPEEWEQKKEYVMKLVLLRVEELGFKLTTEDANALVEGLVKALKG